MPIELTGRVIAITGASSGIGAATAVQCARAGMSVLLIARREDRLREVAGQARAAGVRAEILALDVADPGSADLIVRTAIERLGGLYAVFANAGYGEEWAFTHRMPDDAVRRMFEVNFFACLNLARASVEHFLGRPESPREPRGHMLMCSSCLAKIGMPGYAAYCASKAMQDHFCRAMRVELHARGVRVSSVHPIGTRTEFFEQVANRGGRLVSMSRDRFMQPPETVARAVVRCLRRPRGEVWTSHTMRLALAATGMAPGLTDWALRRFYARRAAKAQALGSAERSK